jgi:hypothetical protein
MQNENLKKLASGLSTKSNAKKDLELIADSQTAKIKGGIKDIQDLDGCADRFKCRNGFSCQTF